MVEVLLNGAASPIENNALAYAVSRKRVDIVRLLLDRGSPVDSIHFSDVCESGDPEMIKLFLERGADPIADFPFYHGFIHCLNPMLGAYKTQLEKFPAIQIQADMALCYYAKEGNLRCVSLLLWAGARPDYVIPEGMDCEFAESSALKEAAEAGHLPILKRMKPENFPDRLAELVSAFSVNNSTEILQYLLTLVGDLGTLPDSGSSLVQHTFWRLGWSNDRLYPSGTDAAARVDPIIERLELLLKHGAKFKSSMESVRSVRRDFRALAPDSIVRIFGLLKQYDAAETPFLENAIATPTMRTHLGDSLRKIDLLLHPPVVQEASRPKAVEAAKSVEKPKLTIGALRANAERFILDVIRKRPVLRFWEETLHESLYDQDLRRGIGMAKDDDRSPSEIFETAVDRINRAYKTFSASFEKAESRGGWSRVKIVPAEGKEWPDVLSEVWEEAGSNPRRLSEPALKILQWAQERKLPNDWEKETLVSWKAGFNGRQRVVEEYLEELNLKTGGQFSFEKKGKDWGREDPLKFKISIQKGLSIDTPLPAPSVPKSLNPVFNGPIDHVTKEALQTWKEPIYNYLLQEPPTASDPVYILWLNTRKQLNRMFPSVRFESRWDSDKITKFVAEIPLHREIKIAYDFREKANVWYFAVLPKTNWQSVISAIEELKSLPTLRERYGLSEEASKLLEWIEGLKDEDYLLNWTPTIEDHQEKKIGFQFKSEKENFPAYIQELVDEINLKTEYELKLQPWKHWSEWQTRVRVSKKESDEAALVRQIQFFGLRHGKILSGDLVRELLTKVTKSEIRCKRHPTKWPGQPDSFCRRIRATSPARS